MKDICLYFQVHQPYRLKKYKVFDIGNNHDYFDEDLNKKIMRKVAKKCYLPTNELMYNLIKKHKGKFKISYSITGVAIEQFKKYSPEVLDSFIKLNKTGCVEFLNETYYHSLAFLYSEDEFIQQVKMHKKLIKDIFKQTPKVFRNTELIFNNHLAILIKELGYKAILTEGADHVLDNKSPNLVYNTINGLKLLLKNYKLSDDIAFRFSNKKWKDWPLTINKFSDWITNSNGDHVNLFMDYETFGEHQWIETGIFKFMEKLPDKLIKNNMSFVTPSSLIKNKTVEELDIHHPISWADMERDLSAWLGNKMQKAAIKEIYELENAIKKSNDIKLIEDWRRLQTSDHFYYMCTKYFGDGDVHKYFNPYDTPYDSYMSFMNILNDIVKRLDKNLKFKISEQPSILINA